VGRRHLPVTGIEATIHTTTGAIMHCIHVAVHIAGISTP